MHRLLHHRPSPTGAARRIALLVSVMALAAATAATALAVGTRSVDLPKTFSTQLPKVKKATTVPILLPRTLPLVGTYKVYPSSSATQNSYDLSLEASPKCGGADSCFVAMFAAKRGAKLPVKANARLAAGDPAYYHPSTCGGSCAPSSFLFTHKGILYSWQANDLPKGDKTILIKMANEAIAAGPR